MPTREEVDLVRAAIDRGFLTLEESVRCLKLQQERQRKGESAPLDRILVEVGFVSEGQLAELKESIARVAALHKVGQYEILSRVGSGGMGTVYKARDTVADRVVALKILSPGLASNRDYIQRFLREARASGQLSHPNIVQGFDAGESNGRYYFAMEFVDGITVGEMLRDGKPIPEQQSLDIAIQVAKALQHAEEHNLVHRDVKPDNIMITREGVAKLADLGLARMTTEAPATRERKAMGTPYYASPEQCEGRDDLDTKSDMYSFGATLFHLLAGRVPYDGDSPASIMSQHLTGRAPYLKDINVQLSHGISKIVRKLMARNKRDRYGTMADVVKDLTLVRMGRSPRLGERSPLDRGDGRYRSTTGSWRTKRPKAWQRIVLAGAGVVLGLGLIAAAYMTVRLVFPSKSARRPDAASGVTSGPKEAPVREPRTEDQIFLEGVITSRDKVTPEEFYAKLRDAAQRYPGTESAKKAMQLAAEVLGDITRDACALLEEKRRAALALCDKQRYGEAMAQFDQFPPKYDITTVPAAAGDARDSIDRAARADFERIRAGAMVLVAAKKFDEAAAALDPVLTTFGIESLREQARAVVADIEKARAEEMRRLAEDARKQEEAARRDKDAADLRAAIAEAKNLVSKSSFAEAAKHLSDVAARLNFADGKPPLERAAADLAALDALITSLKDSRGALKGKTVSLTRKDGTALEGVIFSLGKDHLSLECGTAEPKTIRGMLWTELSPASLNLLIELKTDGKLGPADSRAVATFFFFSGMAAEARAALGRLAANPDLKAEADLRLKDFDLFSEK